MKNNYQMTTVNEYLKILDNEVKYIDNDVKQIRQNVEKYLLQARRAATNAKILEAMLA